MTSDNAVNTAVQGGVTSVVLLYFYSTIQLMLPFLILSVILIVVDLFFGVEAARKRYARTHAEDDRVRPSKALRKTTNKVFEYLCWVVLSASLSVTFDVQWLNYVVMGLVVGNEVLSVLDHYLFVRGKKITGLWEAILRILGKRLDADLEGIEIKDLEDHE